MVAAAAEVFAGLAPLWKTDELAQHVNVLSSVYISARSATVASQGAKELS